MVDGPAPAHATGPPLTAVWRPMFIDALSKTANVTASAFAAGVTRAGAYKARKTSADFAAKWDAAIDEAVDLLAGVAFARAATGESDYLLTFLLKAHRPEVYGDRTQIEHTGPGGGPIEQRTVSIDISIAPEAAQEAVKALVEAGVITLDGTSRRNGLSPG